MDVRRRSTASDYNRGLPMPIRWLHTLLRPVAPIFAWASDERRRLWALPLLVSVIVCPLLVPLDGWLYRQMTSIKLGGDVRRELEALQQYGQLGVSLIVAAVIALLDPKRTRRLLDWGIALGVATGIGLLLKMFLGRPRPVYGEPLTFLGPLGARPLPSGEAVRGPIEFWASGASSLWSMPSSHTMGAAVMSVFLGTMYPRIRPVVVVMVGVVALGRLLTGAHYASDVVAGACLGAAVAGVAVSRGWGVRLIDWLWKLAIDPHAQPAWPGLSPTQSRPTGDSHG